jgi:ABC-2 type transport system permease protein
MNVSAIRGVFLRHVLTIRRTPWGQNDLVVWPVVDVFLFGSVGVFLGGNMSTDSVQFQSVLLGVFMFSLAQVSALSMSILFMDETRSRNVLNLIASPITTAEYVLGIAAASSVRVAVAILTSTLTCIALYGFNPLTIGPSIVIVIAALVISGFITSLMLMALQLRIGSSAENLTWVIAIIPPSISGAIVPIAALPAVIQPLAHALPTAQVFAAARAILNGDGFPVREFGLALVGISIATVVFAGLILLCLRQFRVRGLVTRYS